MDAENANGGFVSSTIELLRFLHSSTRPSGHPVLQFPPAQSVAAIPPVGGGKSWEYDGAIYGNYAALHIDDRTTWCVLMNSDAPVLANLQNDLSIAMAAAERRASQALSDDAVSDTTDML
jgi:hypothetical protein